MKVVLAQDWITDNGGGEACLRDLLDLFPKSPILTLILNEKKVTQFNDTKIITSYLNKYPKAKTHWRYYFPLMPRAVESLVVPESDVVISNCYSAIKGLITKPETLHICYCHTPTRYLWLPEIDQRLSGGNFVKAGIMSKLIHQLRIWDFAAAQRPDVYVANSKNTAKRVEKFYRRKAKFIYPPVDTESFRVSPQNQIGNYYLFVSRLVPYKKADLVVQTFNQLGLPIKIVGDGPDLKNIKKIAKKNVEILGFVSKKERNRLLSRCKAFIFPAEEDFGIAPVEAMASGRPVIAYGKGGALETVKKGMTGIFFKKQNVKSLSEAVEKFEKNKDKFDPEKIKNWADNFSREKYKENWQKLISEALAEHRASAKINIDNI